MKRFFPLVVLFALVMSSGCCSVKICTEGGRDICYVQNYGWKLLGLLPIASGDPEYPNEEVSVWFCDSVLLDVNMMLLDDAAQKNGYTGYKNLVSHKTREDICFILFKRYTYHTSAELLR